MRPGAVLAPVSLFCVVGLATAVAAQAATNQSSAAVPLPPKPSSCAECLIIPALTPVTLEMLATVSSKANKTGDTFPIRLAAPIVLAGKTVIAAGTIGTGEVVHAKKSGGSGAAGELVLAARYLTVNGRPLRLRSMHMAVNGRSRMGTSEAVGIAVGWPAMFIPGGQAAVAQGTMAEAKTAEAFALDPLPSSLPAASPSHS